MSIKYKTVYESQAELLRTIADLFCKGRIDCDVTYGAGNIYKGARLEPRFKFDSNPRGEPDRLQPAFKFDLKPTRAGVIKADCTDIPARDCSYRSVVFDPPFVVTTKSSLKPSMFEKCKYGNADSYPVLLEFYGRAMLEIWRVLRPRGILIFKNQDFVHDHKNYFAHCDIYRTALGLGYIPVDLFILVNENRIIQHNLKRQQHARKTHCYHWVFRKPGKQRSKNV